VSRLAVVQSHRLAISGPNAGFHQQRAFAAISTSVSDADKAPVRCACANVWFLRLCDPSVWIAHDLHILTGYSPDLAGLSVRSSIGELLLSKKGWFARGGYRREQDPRRTFSNSNALILWIKPKP